MTDVMTARVTDRMPTRVGVDALDRAFPRPEPGETMSWEALEDAIGEPKESYRFKSVLTAWRKKLLHADNILLCAIGNNEGLIVADSKLRIDEASSRVERGRRQVEKAIYIACNTDPALLAVGDKERRDRVISLRRTNDALVRLVAQCSA